MASPCIDRDLLTDLKHEAERVAAKRGHRLAPFRNARHDRLRYVSFCTACGGLVIVEAGPTDDLAQRLHGHAWDSDTVVSRMPDKSAPEPTSRSPHR